MVFTEMGGFKLTHAYIPQHLLTLADYLYCCEFSDEKFDLQCIYRTIINRAYYATYLQAREWIFDNSEYNSLDYYMNSETGTHRAVYLALIDLGQEALTNDLRCFKHLRNDADYDIVKIITKNDALKAIKLARHIMSALN